MEKDSNFLKELEYVCKISPISGLIGMRAYLENIINKFIIKKEYLSNENCSKEKLGKKINLLEGKNIFNDKELHLIKSINFKGNDAAHNLKGDVNDALSLYKSLKEIDIVIKKLYSKTESIDLNKERIGIIINYDKIGYIEDELTKEKYIFKVNAEHNQNDITISVGDKVYFNLEKNRNTSKANYKAINIRHIARIEKICRTQHHRYAFLTTGDRKDFIYLDFRKLPEEFKNTIEKGTKLICNIKSGIKKDEAYNIKIA